MEDLSKGINIYKHGQVLSINLNSALVKLSLQEVKKYILSLLGYSSHLYLYQQPLATFNRLNFITPRATFSDILEQFGQVCFTLNNCQNSQQFHTLESVIPKSLNDIVLIAQTCENNQFNHSVYKVDSKARISMLKSLASRIGEDPYVLYYQLRLALLELPDEEPTIVITCDTIGQNTLYKTIKNLQLIDYRNFNLFCLDEQDCFIVIDRLAELKTTLNMLELMFQDTLSLKESITLQQIKKSNIVNLRRGKSVIKLNPPIKAALFVGVSSEYLIFLQKSSIIHVYSKYHPFQLINSATLIEPSSFFVEEYLPIIANDELIMYDITVNHICLKSYSLPQGIFKYAKHYRWDQNYGHAKVDTLDVLFLQLKDTKIVRVFYIHRPNHYMEFTKPEQEWNLHVNKIGNNVLSDGSGLFSITEMKSFTLHVYNLKAKSKVLAIQFQQPIPRIISVRIDQASKKVLVTSQRLMQEYSFQSKLLKVQQKKDSSQLLSSFPNGVSFVYSNTKVKIQGGPQLRIKDSLLIYGDSFQSFNRDLQTCTFNFIHLVKDKPL